MHQYAKSFMWFLKNVHFEEQKKCFIQEQENTRIKDN